MRLSHRIDSLEKRHGINDRKPSVTMVVRFVHPGHAGMSDTPEQEQAIKAEIERQEAAQEDKPGCFKLCFINIDPISGNVIPWEKRTA